MAPRCTAIIPELLIEVTSNDSNSISQGSIKQAPRGQREEEERQESKTKLGVSYDGIEYRIDYHYNNVDSEPMEGSK